MKTYFKLITFTITLFALGMLSATPRLSVQYWDEETQTELSGTWELYLADGTFVGGPYPTGANNLVDLTLNESYRIKAAVSVDNGNKSYLHWNSNDLSHYSMWNDFTPVTDQVYSKHAYFMTKTSAIIQATDGVEIWIHDPWLTDANDEPYGEDHFVPLSQLAPNGSYEVFDGRGLNIGFMTYPYYKVKVKRLNATLDGIYEFEGFNNTDVLVESATNWDANYYSVLSFMVLNSPSPVLQVDYISTTDHVDYIINIYAGESLTIKEGANILFAQNVTINCEGNFTIGENNGVITNLTTINHNITWNGITVQPTGVIIVKNAEILNTNDLDNGGSIKLISSSDTNCSAEFDHVSFSNNFSTDIKITGGYYNCNSPDPILIKNCRFDDTIGETLFGALVLENTGRDVLIDNCEVKHSIQAISPGGLLPFTGHLEITNSKFIREYSDIQTYDGSASPSIFIMGNSSVTVKNNEFINALDDDINPEYPIFDNLNSAIFIVYYDLAMNASVNTDDFWSGILIADADPIPDTRPVDWNYPTDTRIPPEDCTTNYSDHVIIENNTTVQYTSLAFMVAYTPHQDYTNYLSIRNNIFYSPVGSNPYELPAPITIWGANNFEHYLSNMLLDYNNIFADFNNSILFYRVNPNNIFLITGSWHETGDNDLFIDPLFVNPVDFQLNQWPFDYDNHLLFESPCINAGDPNLPLDTDGSPSDIGYAYHPLIKGDCTNDGQVSVNDMVLIVAITLGNTIPNNAEIWTADYNNDGVIDVLDVVAIRACIIDGNCLYRQGSSPGSGEIIVKKENSLSRNAGDSMTISVAADVDIAGLQLELTYDPSIEQFINIEETEFSANLELNYKEDNGSIFIVMYSIDNNLINAGLTDILTVNFNSLCKLSETFALSIADVMLVDEQAHLLHNNDSYSPLPNSTSLIISYPNPFNPVTTIRYDLPESGQVDIMIYDMLGHEVTHLVNAVEAAGYHSVNWDASEYASGAYFVKMTSGEFTQTQKLMLVK